MIGYILHRIAWSIPVLITISLITFTLMHLAPGDPEANASDWQLRTSVTLQHASSDLVCSPPVAQDSEVLVAVGGHRTRQAASVMSDPACRKPPTPLIDCRQLSSDGIPQFLVPSSYIAQ